ncbi:hypothetical protein FS815_24565 [Agrobacterium vitis]|uniref:hypothetical protein n=1 Tax=Allorhizobium ampelinum TaxID=3025782 RepID=UPI001F2836BA|nr:hypothetical protein [Allorhizobium ampelinum]MCF1449967.1 hypothetical protein [Allorhizobium ampelinum]
MTASALPCLACPAILVSPLLTDFIGARLNRSINSYNTAVTGYIQQRREGNRNCKPDAENDDRYHQHVARSRVFARVDDCYETDADDHCAEYCIEGPYKCAKKARFMRLQDVSAVDASHGRAGNSTVTIGTGEKSQNSPRELERILSSIAFRVCRNDVSQAAGNHLMAEIRLAGAA